MIDVSNFGQRVAETRAARKQSYRDVARETGLLISTLHKVEHGGDPRLSTVEALLAWLEGNAKLADEETPDEGHTFRLTVNVRGAHKVVGDEHAHDQAEFHADPWEIEVREHSLSAALRKAAEVPFNVWAESDGQVETETRRLRDLVAELDAELDDGDQWTDHPMRPNYYTIWGLRRLLVKYGGKPHRWQIEDFPDINSVEVGNTNRLNRIAEMHHQNVDEHGGTSGYCNECPWVWPCPTYQHAVSTDLTHLCAWDLRDCNEGQDHDHEVLRP